MRSVGFALFALTLGAGAVQAQNETALRAALEGQVITVKIDMPATSRGVDVFPQEQIPVNFRDVAQRIKDSGTAVRMGQQIMITKVAIKGNSHIEVQLGGGGHGTFGDWLSSSSSSTAVAAAESSEERSLREAIAQTSDREEKKQLERELNALRSARQRDNARAEAEARQANEAREANMRTKRLDSGSRFNLRFKHGLPHDVLTPEGIARALSQYVEFTGPLAAAAGAPTTTTPAITPAPAAEPAANAVRLVSNQTAPVTSSNGSQPATGLAALKKGQTLNEVESILGAAVTAGEVREGAMNVMKRTYAFEGMKVATSFVSGVMIDFSITPQ